jgi:uncharacterized membrane protein YfcA
LILDLSLVTLGAIAVAALATGILHGATGMAGGIVMAAILAHLIGIKAAVPVMTVALFLSHLSRTVMYTEHTDWSIVRRVLLFGCPTIVLGAIVFGKISAATVAIVFAAFLTSSFPMKYWARRHEIRTGPVLLSAASSVWGMLAGNVIGPGFFLAPFLLGTGMNRLTFVGTLATVTLVMNVLKMGVFGATDLLNWEMFTLGAAIGVITVPGNWLGRSILKGMKDSDHRLVIDVMTVLMIVNFVYIAMSADP